MEATTQLKGIACLFGVGLYELHLVRTWPALDSDQLALWLQKQCGAASGNRS